MYNNDIRQWNRRKKQKFKRSGVPIDKRKMILKRSMKEHD